MEVQAKPLAQQWEELKAANPGLRIRNAAEELGTTELQLLATKCGDSVTRLKPEFAKILAKVETLGKVMALTRNDSVVHERKGTYLNPSLDNPHVGLFVGEDIDLRIFFQTWKSAFAVSEAARGQERMSIQFFDKYGSAVHKIYLTPKSSTDAYKKLIEEFVDSDQSQEEKVEIRPAADAEKPDSEIDVQAFQKSWLELKDSHDFFPLLRKHKLTRTQALRLAPKGNYALRVSNEALRATITKAAEQEVPIMVFVGNPGMIQIHTGPVKKLLDHNEWFNVMDPDFNLHIKEPDVAEAWVVRKPSEDGMVTALEVFDKDGTQIVQLFGKRKPGIPELVSWRTIISEVEKSCKL